MKIHRIVRSTIVGCVVFMLISWNVVAWAQGGTIFLPLVASSKIPAATPTPEQRVIDLVLTVPHAQEWLDQNSGWQTNVYQTDEGANLWKVDFCNGQDCSEWLGYGTVNLNTDEVVESFFPRTLSTEEFASGKTKVETYVKYDPEIAARMENPDLWYYEVDWNRWEQFWEARYSYGLEVFTVRLGINQETGKVELNSIVNPNEMDEASKEIERMDRVRQLIWEAEGVGEAVDGHDNFKTYVEHQGDNLYTIAFVADGNQLFSALIDVETGTILESGK